MSAETEKAVELFVRCENAEMFLEDVRGDDPELVGAEEVGRRRFRVAAPNLRSG